MMLLCLFVFALPIVAQKKGCKNDARVYLEHADNLRFDQYGPSGGAQIAKGNVKFLHKGSTLWCDSAYFYQQSETFKAFGNVKMKQGDTLSLKANYAWYDGGAGREILYASRDVVLTHKTTTLYTDSLVFDRMWNFAYYLNGGKMVDKGNELVSEWGEYHTDTRLSSFYFDVDVTGKDFKLHTDTLNYDVGQSLAHVKGPSTITTNNSVIHTNDCTFDNKTSKAHSVGPTKIISDDTVIESTDLHYDNKTSLAHSIGPTKITTGKAVIETDDAYFNNKTSQAHVVGPSTIVSDGTVITTTDGYYNSKSKASELKARSKVENGERMIEADTLNSNDITGLNEGYGNVIYIDKKNKNRMECGYFQYNQKTGHGFATREPLIKDFSQRDTLYMHSDTMRIETFHINTDSVYRKVHAYPHARAYRIDVQAVADSIVGCSRDSSMVMYRDPIVWHGEQQLVGEEIHVFMRDSTIDRAHVIGQAFSTEKIRRNQEELRNSKSVDRYNQISSREMWAYFDKGKLRQAEAISNVLADYYMQDDKDSSFIGMVYIETDTMRMYMKDGQLDKIWSSKSNGTMYPVTQIPANKQFLPNFAWFDYIRPRDQYDLFEWRPKKPGSQLKQPKRLVPTRK